MDAARTPFVDLLDFDNPEEGLLFQDVAEPANGEDVHVQVIADPLILVVQAARQEGSVVGVDAQFCERQQRRLRLRGCAIHEFSEPVLFGVLLCLADVFLRHLLCSGLVGDLAGVAKNVDRLPSIAVFLRGEGRRERNHVLGKDAVLEGVLAIEHDLPELVSVVWLEEQFLVLEAAFHALVHVVDVLDLVADRDDTDATVDFPRLLSARELHQHAVVVHQIDLVEDDDHRIELSVERLPEEFVVFRRTEAGMGTEIPVVDSSFSFAASEETA